MSLHLYSTLFPEPLSPTVFQELLSRLPVTLQKKVLAYRRWQDAYGSLFGKLLLEKALRQAGFSADLTDLRVTEYGRPYLEGCGGAYPEAAPGNVAGADFNISHSGNRVVCILSTQGRVGIDLEKAGDVAIDDFQSQFTAAEWTAIKGAAMPLHMFYYYWTAKESLIKADGRGLQIPLNSLEVGGRPSVLVDGQPWYIRDMPIFPHYACHIACEHPIDLAITEEISPDMF
jgi:4'-phosphopantetheinyl transferase